MPTPPSNSSRNEKRSSPKKIPTKKSTSSSSSGAHSKTNLQERFSQLIGLDLIYGNFRKMLFRILYSKIEKVINNKNLDPSLINLRINKLFAPLETLSHVLCNVKDSIRTKENLRYMFGMPFSVRQVLDMYEFDDRAELNREKRAIRRLADKLVMAGIFGTDHIHNKKWNLPYNKKQKDALIFYMLNYHNDEEIFNYVIRYYYPLAKTLGTREDKEEPKKKKEKVPKLNKFGVCTICMEIIGNKSCRKNPGRFPQTYYHTNCG